MLRKLAVVLILGIFVFTFAHLASAMDMSGDNSMKMNMDMTQPSSTGNPAQKTEAVNAGNKICPVTGEKIDEKTKVTYEYQGKIYNFCCEACPDEFKKDPEKYIKKVEQELRAESKGQATHEGHEMGNMQDTGTSHQGMHH